MACSPCRFVICLGISSNGPAVLRMPDIDGAENAAYFSYPRVVMILGLAWSHSDTNRDVLFPSILVPYYAPLLHSA